MVIINIHGGNNLILPNAPQSLSDFQDVHIIEHPTDESETTIIYNIYDGHNLIAPEAQLITPSTN